MGDMSRMRFQDKRILIIGGAGGLGKKIAEDVIKEGGKVVIGDISEKSLQEIDLGPNCLAIKVNAVVEEEVEAAVKLSVDTWGGLDGAVNSIQKTSVSALVDYDVEKWRQEIDVCLNGVFIALKHEGRQMIKQGGGSIVNMASLRSKLSAALGGSYCVSKAGMAMLTKVAAQEMSPDGVRINCVSPGLTRTPATEGIFAHPKAVEAYLDNIPCGRVGTAEDTAAAVLFFLSDESTWITGENLSVDGGWNLNRYPDMRRIFK